VIKMREILFRGKRMDNGEWTYGLITILFRDKEYHIVNRSNESIVYPIEPTTIGEYTGLTDKNGQKIFEGDIICVANAMGKNNYPVVCRKGAFWLYDELLIDNEGLDFLASYIPSYIEVVGNIYDNPELLG